jgi:hypothetical protein
VRRNATAGLPTARGREHSTEFSTTLISNRQGRITVIFSGLRFDRKGTIMTLSGKLSSLPKRANRGLKSVSRGLEAFSFHSARSPGSWHSGDLRVAASLVREIRGDFIELGAWYGNTTKKMVPLAAEQAKRVHAVDSFEGMASPTAFDFRPAGNLSIGGVQKFYATMDKAAIDRSTYDVHVGWIPEVFSGIPDRKYSFAIIDLDNYQPTVDSIDWLWPRVSSGGIVAFDDFYPSNMMECSRAIKEFLRRERDHCIVGFQNYQLYVQKIDGELPTGHVRLSPGSG